MRDDALTGTCTGTGTGTSTGTGTGTDTDTGTGPALPKDAFNGRTIQRTNNSKDEGRINSN